jgi:hypothetical protein
VFIAPRSQARRIAERYTEIMAILVWRKFRVGGFGNAGSTAAATTPRLILHQVQTVAVRSYNFCSWQRVDFRNVQIMPRP